jgi:hypothetical protein
MRRPLGAIEHQQLIRLEFRIGPGVVGDIAIDMVVVVGDGEIVHADGLAERDDLADRVVARILAVARVDMKVAL